PHAVAQRSPQEDLDEGIDQVVHVEAPARGAERVQERRVDRVRIEGRAVACREGVFAARPYIGAEALPRRGRVGHIANCHPLSPLATGRAYALRPYAFKASS